MKILLMANHLNTGGISTYLLNLSRGLARKGHQVWVACGDGNCVELLKRNGVHHVRMDIRVKSEAHPKIFFALPAMVRMIKTEKIDLIHANTRVTQVMAALAARLTGKPFVSTCHGFFNPRRFRRMFPCWGKGVIAISHGVREHLIKDFHLLPSSVRLIPNGIDLDQFAMAGARRRQELRRQWKSQGHPIVGIIARLSGVKGIDVLINAMPAVLAQFPRAKLWIVGEGPQLNDLRNLVETKGLSTAVRFEPVINRSADILPIFDVFVMPSLQEGLGLSVMEAQAAGIPVVASDVGGLPDLIEDGKTGLLAPPGNSDALAQKIIMMLKGPQRASAMAAAAKEQVAAKFSLEQMTSETVNFYEQYSRR
ncbi:MAG: glycosyltransferase family 4 protein [Candidatus Omnitrophica bacterium]|nr:glycosyltransferase family 4 protein [Candidatus Omnitrophota bacterium]